ncbi:16S rRNA (cytosine(1402)-N(4))-methyltransferase RsmH [bacterium]|nr:16S rRNA (cytosine(1402)-N(4))-methyltransferase RsmH [bacterium]
MSIHKPVLLEESLEKLNLKKGSVVVDATLGGGGHSLEILKRILPGGKLIAIDRDEEAIKNFKSKLKDLNIGLKKENLELVNDNFAGLGSILEALKIERVDAILADFGMSSDQLEDAERGFSFKKDAELDMRMDQNGKQTAREIINTYSQNHLEKILREFGEERYARKIAKAIILQRKIKPIEKTLRLAEIISSAVPGKYRRGKKHFAVKTFQALRIEVNNELENIKCFLPQAIDILKTAGRLAVISFHSGEDRIVKNLFKENARGCICPPKFPICRCGRKPRIKIISKKPIIPKCEEIEINPRARSAKLRVAEKI